MVTLQDLTGAGVQNSLAVSGLEIIELEMLSTASTRYKAQNSYKLCILSPIGVLPLKPPELFLPITSPAGLLKAGTFTASRSYVDNIPHLFNILN